MTFETALLGWHDFCLASAGAAAALLGLLFVGVSISLGGLNPSERLDLRVRAGQAFTNLTLVLILSLSALIPEEDAQSLAIACGILAAIGLFRVLLRLWVIGRSWRGLDHGVLAIRRLAWTLIAVVLLGNVTIQLWSDGTDGRLDGLVAVVFLLLIGAADVSWDLLTTISIEEREAVKQSPTPSQSPAGRP